MLVLDDWLDSLQILVGWTGDLREVLVLPLHIHGCLVLLLNGLDLVLLEALLDHRAWVDFATHVLVLPGRHLALEVGGVPWVFVYGLDGA